MSKQRVDLPRRTKTRKRRSPSIKWRIRRMVLVPSVLLALIVLVGGGFLSFQGFYVRQVAVSVRQVSIPAVDGLTSIEKERRLSMALLTEPSQSRQQLDAQRQVSDQRLDLMRSRATAALAQAPQDIKDRMADLTVYLDRLAGVRNQVNAGTISAAGVFAFYNDLLDAAIRLFNTQARTVPDVTATQGGIAATNLFRLGDLMSRAGSRAATAFAAGKFDAADFNSFAQLVGAYHSQLQLEQLNVVPDVQAGVRTLVASEAWKKLVTAENALLAKGPWTEGVPSGLPVGESSWNLLATTVSDGLIALAKQQADIVSLEALNSGNGQLLSAGLGSLLALVLAIAVFVWSLRQSTALAARLGSLRDRSLALVGGLPDVLRRVRENESRDTRPEMLGLTGFGEDEIGQVADAIGQAQVAAVGAAVREADGREGTQKLLVGIARRLQGPQRQLLDQLKALQNEEKDPDRLQQLYALDHLAAMLQRNVENLVILGGERPGRRWRDPVPLRNVVRAAAGETKHFKRVKVEVVPDALDLNQNAVAEVIHMIADLLDNALQFSSPGTIVQVRSFRVDQGVVVEIEDQGFGMSPQDLARFNKLLGEPPTFSVRDLGDASQLGFWVIASLAGALDGRVHLRDSPYGGVRAIVLLPRELFVETSERAAPPELPAARRQDEPAELPGEVPAPVQAWPDADGVSEPNAPMPGLPLPKRLGETAPDNSDPRYAAPLVMTQSAMSGRHAANSAQRPSPRPVVTPLAPEQRPAMPRLPVRERGQSLAPELRDGPPADAGPESDGWSEADTRSSEDIRRSLSSLQEGTRKGRES
ncbi:sensor histidine kinase [Fodinicola acaciae]|uniref:sensor histidine kinase n=1 Tax=Fodinicola acaciae TaxID=2681555 RepID=UPI0013D648A3|nr:nitrate- and nitrite sensing domain-containing protein [Fodinicola acaciae]